MLSRSCLALVCAAGLGLLVTTAQSPGDTIVSFTGDNVTQGTIGQPWDPPIVRTPDSTGTNLVWNFSTTSAMDPANTGQSALIYGGLSFTGGASTQTATPSVSHSADYYKSCLLLQYNDNVVSPDPHFNTDVTWVNVWTKAGFLNGASSGAVGFDANSSLSVDIKNWNTGWWATNELRFVVNNGGNWYASADLSGANPTTGTYSLPSLSTATWYSYTPSGATFGLSQIGSTATPTFNDVQAVGFLGTGGAGYYRTFQFDNFNATAAVPEPAMLGLVALSGLALISRRRRA